MYTDDGTLFLQDVTQVSAVIKHIQNVAKFISPRLNVSKTVIFDPHSCLDSSLHGMLVTSKPVKYLGAFVGTGDLSCLNFDLTLQKAHRIASHWNKWNLFVCARSWFARPSSS